MKSTFPCSLSQQLLHVFMVWHAGLTYYLMAGGTCLTCRRFLLASTCVCHIDSLINLFEYRAFKYSIVSSAGFTNSLGFLQAFCFYF